MIVEEQSNNPGIEEPLICLEISGLFCYGVIFMSILNQIAQKTERAKEERKKEKINKHRCKGCSFGSWTGTKYYCPFSSCAKESLRR